MIGNCYQGSDFSPITTYLLSKPGASRIGGNMIFLEPDRLIQEFNFIRSLKPNAQKAALHVSFSLPVGESLQPKQWQSVADRYMKEINLDNNQYIVVRHSDTPHDHIHVLASRIRLDRKLSSLWQNKPNTEKFIRQIEKDFNLQQIPSSWETPKRPENANSAARRDYVSSALDSALNLVTDLDQLREHLRLHQIGIRETKKAGVTMGITYRFSGIYINGKDLNRPYSVIVEKLNQNRDDSLSLNFSAMVENPESKEFSTIAENVISEITKTTQKRRGCSR